MKRPAAQRRSAGTKKHPTCSICKATSHYGSTCPNLAQKLLQAVRRKSGLNYIVNVLESKKSVTVLEAGKKPQRTPKRRARGSAAAAKKARQGKEALQGQEEQCAERC